MLTGSSDPEAFLDLAREIPNFHLTHLPGLHAKVYIADTRMAVITSGNLTHSGLRGNVEYGVKLSDQTVVRTIRKDFEDFDSLGAVISMQGLGTLAAEMQDLKAAFSEAQKSMRKEARKIFEHSLDKVNVQLLRQRVKGKSTHSIFEETLKVLLSKGPLTTVEIQPRVQALHPDLCDDSIDRTIDGVNFGKRWKHYVRTAQQHLKKRGEIAFDGGRWSLKK
jgi:hypothetical protein